VGGCAAFLALARRASVPRLTLTVLFAIASVSSYGLATRLFPSRFGIYEAAGIYRLSEPIGYWNGLGIFAVLGILLALGFVGAREASPVARALAAVALTVLPVTLYFTFSRGSWVSLGFGFAVSLVASPKRLRLLAATATVLPGPLIGVYLASKSHALTHEHAALSAAVREGRHLALALVLLTGLTIACAFAFSSVSTRVSVGGRGRRLVGGAIVVALLLLLAAGLIHFGGPVEAGTRGYHAFVAPPPSNRADLNERLLNLSGNGRGQLWRYAWRAYRAHPVLGSGAGTYERAWQKNANTTLVVRDAHGLYIETLAELGPVGLLLLVGALVVPVVAGARVRRHTLVPTTLGSYLAFVLHAGADWDWELAGVTLTALVIGCLLLVQARRGGEETLGTYTRYPAAVVALLLGAFSAVGLLGNIPLGRSTRDAAAGRYERAFTEADRAHRFQPWSPKPWIARGEAQLGLGLRSEAAASFRKAISIDDGDWQSWLDLAVATRGRTRARALAHAKRLYPASSAIADAEADFKTSVR
jgi:O-antigen ligase/polysaccharide polymerase Wzy-like membrane protein